MMRIVFIGDIVGNTGRRAIQETLKDLIHSHRPDCIIANGENITNGKGISHQNAKELFGMGIHVITLGNHAWDQREIFDYIDTEPRVIRPANFPPGTPGDGQFTLDVKGNKLTVINLQGRTFMQSIDCPFQTADRILAQTKSDFVLVDFHAEATSEKQAIGWYLDGKVSAVVGTHTHVQTNDARILPNGTAYITDVGMTGSRDGILGVEKEAVIRKFTLNLPAKFQVDSGKYQVNAVCLDLDNRGRATKISTICIFE